ncbi:class II fructose-1,6-bisphosphate aldolase [[Mycoplasma] mobile]|uniref:Fructose-bisphosphate aldolase n=1 Tax=Mycoplasma mobile (strain ATCC 43663 / 163K / NCTC 11711) TaxID=267748 RepID=Q6KIG4_MYCM1|nr:class II fructose-1,6-bisphosphate aldolase [[Mycoplasma] mobile]AAT27612.1 fructose-bisphosphate aldolase [Mycoplasma mobile 163K]
MNKTKLVNAKEMLKKAYLGKYAIPHINTNNLEWTKTILLTAQEMNSPLIIGASEGAIKYMGGMKTVHALVSSLIEDLKITVPIALHLDHGSYEGVEKALEAGFTSIMFDGSHLSFEENYKKSKELIKKAAPYNVSFEVEVGSIGGEEDGIIGEGEIADPKEALKMSNLGVDVVAAGIGNIHGPYPASWKSLNFDALKNIEQEIKKGIVLHGGSGIPTDQIKKAISLGVSKININSELQWANKKAIKEFVISGKIDVDKNYDPRKIYAPGIKAMAEVIKEKIIELGSQNKA